MLLSDEGENAAGANYSSSSSVRCYAVNQSDSNYVSHMTTRDGKLRNVRGAHPSAPRNGAHGGETYGVSVDSGRPFVSHESLKKGGV